MIKFIRKNGRIIPIRERGENIAAGAAVAGTAYAASRIPIKSKDPKLEFSRRMARALEDGEHSEALPMSPRGFDLSSKLGFAKVYGKNAIKTKLATPETLAAFKGKKFVIKPNEDSMGRMENFFTDKSKAVPKSALKGSHVIQPRLNIEHEYRVTAAAGKVTSITHRRLNTASTSPIGGWIPVVKGRGEIKHFVENSLKSGKIPHQETGILGLDVARTKKGLKMIEANIHPGDLLNPIKSTKAKSYVLGRLPKRAALVASALVGFGAYKWLQSRRKRHD